MSYELERIVDATAATDKAGKRTTTDKRSIATTLVEMALARYDFGVSTDGEAFALPRLGPKVVSMFRGSKASLRGQLAREYFRECGRVASQQALADALLAIDGMAQEAEPSELNLRTATHEGAIWLDLGDQSGRAVRITPNGWTICPDPPILFKRTILTHALPEPVEGTLEGLWELLNVSVEDRPLLAAWLVSSLYPNIAHPVLGFFGEQGTAKTTGQKMLVNILDPGPVPTRKPPRDPESWVNAAAGSWVVGLDNLSIIQPWLSDSICRAVTGDGDVRRRLYTDGEHVVFAFRRCVCLNGIDLGATRGDLGERLLPIHLDIIPESKRFTEEEIWSVWDRAHAGIVGAVLDLAASVMRVLPSVHLALKPRMADFARILAAVDSAMGTKGLLHYVAKQRALAHDSLAGDPFTLALMELRPGFTGTSAELLERLMPVKPTKGWPQSARAVTQTLKRNAPALRKAGWNVSDDGGHNITNTLRWTIERPEIIGASHSSGSSDSGVHKSTGHTSYGNRLSLGDDASAKSPSDVSCPRCDDEGCRHCENTRTYSKSKYSDLGP